MLEFGYIILIHFINVLIHTSAHFNFDLRMRQYIFLLFAKLPMKCLQAKEKHEKTTNFDFFPYTRSAISHALYNIILREYEHIK